MDDFHKGHAGEVLELAYVNNFASFRYRSVPLETCLLPDSRRTCMETFVGTLKDNKNKDKWRSAFDELVDEQVEANLSVLKDTDLAAVLTERQISVLAVTVATLQQMGFDPFKEVMIVQVDVALEIAQLRTVPPPL